MRIDWLKIPAYRNLHDFEINFDETQPTTVLLGHNGSGKSNLIEAIVEIFRELDSGKPASFAYAMRYNCNGSAIEINSNPEAKRRLTIKVDGASISQTEFNTRKDTWLPQYIFGYYSGWSSRLERQFDEKTRRYYYDVLKSPDNDMPLRRFFFCRKEYSQLVLLAFFLVDDPKVKKLLSDFLQIDSFETALFVMNKPWWGRSSKPGDRENVDPRFWNAGGAFRPFLSTLWENALAPIRNTEAVERDIRHRGETTERLYLFIKNENQLTSLRKPQESIKQFFANLESLYLCDLVDEVRVRVRKKDGNRVTFSQLSEGEQQLLTVLGLLLFTQDDESLYLLDEPDTHLNPVWTYDYLRLLQENIRTEKGQLIVATHDPLMVGSLFKNQVRVMNQDEKVTTAVEPEYDPLGIGIEGLLKSELYGLRSSLPRDVLNDIDTQNELVTLQNRTPEQEEILKQATDRLNKLGITRNHPNPLFDLFAKAVANEPIFKKPELSKEDIEAQEKLANEILDKIMREKSK
ncbi:MAG: AAA family ATPase [Smithella sp.]